MSKLVKKIGLTYVGKEEKVEKEPAVSKQTKKEDASISAQRILLAYLLDKNKVYLGYKMFSKICKPINKKNLNKLLIDNNDDNLSYTCFKNTHIINDFINNESTKLVIGSSHIKVKSNSMYPSLFNTLKGIPYLFVCDFQNMDYFYLKSIMFSR